ncbi:MAG: LCP family protein [Dehalococcoidia bacterium]|nr:LCP family protein [Dehalococcoidia bacterium]
MDDAVYADEYWQTGRSGSTAALVSVLLCLTALVTAATAVALLTVVTPAVLPGSNLYIPGVTQALGGLAVEAPGPEHPFNRPISILVMGVDQRPGESNLSVRTDSIAVVRLDPATHRATVLSVPRDMWVTIHAPSGEVYQDRVNESYQVGASHGGSIAAGARQLMRDLEANFGIEADHYAWLQMSGAHTLIDARGGIDVTIPESLGVPDWRYTEDDVTNPQVLSFPPGEHHLSGYEAVAFSRYRGDSDLYRAQRQQLVLRSLLADPFSAEILLNPIDALQAATTTVKSDLSVARLATLALLASRSSDSIETYSLGQDVNGAPTVFHMVTADGAAVLDWNPGNVAFLVEQARATR